MRRQLIAAVAATALGAGGIVGLAGVATAHSTPAPVAIATVKGSNVGCTVTWTGRSLGQIASYEAFTFTSVPASVPAVIGTPNAANGVHPGGSASSTEVLTPGTTSASLVFHAVNNYGQQQTINLTIPTPDCPTAPPSVSVSFGVSSAPNFCNVIVTLAHFAPNTTYPTTYTVTQTSDGFVFAGNPFSGPSLTTDATGNDTTGVFSLFNQNRSIVYTVNGVSSPNTVVAC
jgi:hypothetical protein